MSKQLLKVFKKELEKDKLFKLKKTTFKSDYFYSQNYIQIFQIYILFALYFDRFIIKVSKAACLKIFEIR